MAKTATAEHHLFHALLLFVFAFWLFGFHVGDASLWDIDEPNNAQCLKEMIAHDNYVVPTFNGNLRPDKPILNYWLMDLGVRLLGMNSWGLRIGSVALGALLVLYLSLALRRLLGARAALLTGLFTATALHSQIIFRAAVPDPLVIFLVTVSLLSYLRGYLYPEERRWQYPLSYAAMGLGTLCEGPIFFLLPGLIITVFLLLRQDLPHLWREGRLRWGLPLFLVLTLPWYLAVGIETHWRWDLLFIAQQNVGRYTGAMQGHQGPIFYYLISTFLGLLPWSVFFPQVFAPLWLQRREYFRSRPDLLFFGLWAGLWIAFFSLGATKLPNYVWEAYPPLLALLAWRVELALSGVHALSGRGIVASLVALAALGGILLGLGATLVPQQIPPLGAVAYIGLPYLAAALLALYFVYRGQFLGVIGSLGAGAVALTFCLVLLLLPALDRLKPSVHMGEMVRGMEGSRPYSLATWRWWEPSFLFYAGRGAMTATQLTNPQQQIPQLLAKHPGPLFLVLPQRDLPALHADLTSQENLRELYHAYELYSRQQISLVRIDAH
ncbi:glycosyltransferase family 39 protein [Candidatus Igneacidithiobacillus taiwanensis]|uniref:ArnT family glycosyltransferase n=1 Tax=Candidatus Igneacidithiobacillus taiwanensis TaxID=1945924 RepID=UPI00289C25ED|nr:glycosyltransferase family 39 protein [Candidatus Igneacidithiobacillus taiwanensis]MCE5359455.1 glycosyltransferase family 39 protein [Acidithiobacillus sp.]